MDNLESPLSFSQQRIWIFSQVSGQGAVYNVPFGFSISSGLNVEAFKLAVGYIVDRHTILRSTYHHRNYTPFQRVESIDKLHFTDVDLRHLAPVDQQAKCSELIKENTQKAFDFETELPIRVTLFRLSEDAYHILLVINHIAYDGWSIGIFNSELAQAYNAFKRGEEPELNALSSQYQDYAKAQRAREAQKHYEKSLEYWKDRLQFPLAQLDLSDQPGTDKSSLNGTTVEFYIDTKSSQALKKRAVEQRVSMYVMMLGLFKTAVYGMTKQEDITLGSPFANRHHAGVDGLLGFFVNMLPIRTKLNADMSFDALLKQLKYYVLSSLEHQEQPIEPLLHHVRHEVKQLIHCLFSFQDIEQASLGFDELQYDRLAIDPVGSKLDITIVFYAEEDRIRGEIEYNQGVFSLERITHIIDSIERVANTIGGDEHPEKLSDIAKHVTAFDTVNHAPKKMISTVKRILPASVSQKTIYQKSAMSTHAKYLIASHMRFNSKLSHSQFGSLYHQVIAQNDILRATFKLAANEQGKEQLYCEIRSKEHVDFECVDLQQLSKASAAKVSEDQIAQSYQTPFVLDQDVLLRCRVYHMGDGEYVLSIVVHHVLIDGISFHHLQSILISAFSGQGVTAPDTSYTYVDYLAEESQQEAQNIAQALVLSSVLEKGKSFNWDAALLQVEKVQHAQCAYEFLLEQKTEQQLRALAKHFKVTIYTLGMALFAQLIKQFSDAEVIHIYSAKGIRPESKQEQILGLFLNWNIYQIELNDIESFELTLSQVKSQYYQYFDPRTPSLLEIEQLNTGLARKQVSFGFQDYYKELNESDSVQVSHFVSPYYEAKQDLSFNIVSQRDGLYCALTYDNTLFNQSSVMQLADAFSQLIGSLSARFVTPQVERAEGN